MLPLHHLTKLWTHHSFCFFASSHVRRVLAFAVVAVSASTHTNHLYCRPFEEPKYQHTPKCIIIIDHCKKKKKKERNGKTRNSDQAPPLLLCSRNRVSSIACGGFTDRDSYTHTHTRSARTAIFTVLVFSFRFLFFGTWNYDCILNDIHIMS